MLRTFLRLTALAGTLAFAALPAHAETKLRIGHNQPEAHPTHTVLLQFADKVKELSKGEVTVTVIPNSQLGDARAMLEQVQNGVLDMSVSSVASLEAFVPEFKVFNLPYLFDSREHFFKVLEGEFGSALLEAGRKKDIVGLFYMDAGARSFYAKKPIKTPDDLKGMKIRVQPSPTNLKMIELMGGAPTPIAWGEVFAALQNGVVDGAENNVTALTIARHGEVAKVFSRDEHTRLPDIVLVGTATLDKLSKAQQQALQLAAKFAAAEHKKAWAAAEETEEKKAREMGVTFAEVDKAAFREKTKPMIEEARKDKLQASVIDRIAASR
ncbi:TRAP transporter substrate-binding protein [Chelatococcus sp. SYSU_G07232]|uniref:TRAP transporter substrate-binding protein n=1 Tax=Chelatococcus albus TaxID=3047466 RepID=A0ABT7ALB9_9HYPH|nr:TRAP transporter substrate-binding protein [Chelatococcus sp. SYSU_G07232]MDJ1160176.1 TRAP transporter substrate-binding protein [Chelatococcus sp. SYSU_G07232]